MTQIYLALYKAKGTWRDRLVRWFTKSPYSHCEMAVTQNGTVFDCCSASFRDGGVRLKTMALPNDKWDLIAIADDAVVEETWQLYRDAQNQDDDFRGALGLACRGRHRWFASYWCAKALGLSELEQFNIDRLIECLCSFNTGTP